MHVILPVNARHKLRLVPVCKHLQVPLKFEGLALSNSCWKTSDEKVEFIDPQSYLKEDADNTYTTTNSTINTELL